jgi:hypothetical protein
MLHKRLHARYRGLAVFDYSNTREYTKIRIEGARKNEREALQRLLNPSNGRHPFKSLVRFKCPSLYSIAAVVPVIGGILMGLIGIWLVRQSLNRPGRYRVPLLYAVTQEASFDTHQNIPFTFLL